MSYCRWSTDDFQCDLYIYQDTSGGYTTHVAGNRIVLPEDLPPQVDLTPETADAWFERHRKVMDMLDNIEREPIDLLYAGESFNDPDIETLIGRLLHLKALGYRFPDSVIEELREEWQEETNAAH